MNKDVCVFVYMREVVLIVILLLITVLQALTCITVGILQFTNFLTFTIVYRKTSN